MKMRSGTTYLSCYMIAAAQGPDWQPVFPRVWRGTTLSVFMLVCIVGTSGDIPEQPVRPSDPPEASPCQRASGQPNAWCKMMAKDAFGSLKIDKKRCCDDYVGDRLNFQRRFWEGRNYFWA